MQSKTFHLTRVFLSEVIVLRKDLSLQAFILITSFVLNTEGVFVYLGGHSENLIARGAMPGRDE